jgi:hypothetical protein
MAGEPVSSDRPRFLADLADLSVSRSVGNIYFVPLDIRYVSHPYLDTAPSCSPSIGPAVACLVGVKTRESDSEAGERTREQAINAE